jgi:4,5-DOPA dioxygenase extradiol
MDTDSWGIDHGTWSVLVHAFPQADIPVVQLAINATKPFDYHFELGAKLAPLRDGGVLIVGAEIMTSSPADVGELESHEYFMLAVPTPDHFIPLLYVAGLASAAGEPAQLLVDGYAMGSLSMACYTLGCGQIELGSQPGSPVLPDIPADETNI